MDLERSPVDDVTTGARDQIDAAIALFVGAEIEVQIAAETGGARRQEVDGG